MVKSSQIIAQSTLRSPLSLAEREAIFSEVHRLKQSNPDLDFAALRGLLSSRFERLPSLETLKRWNANSAAPMTSVNKFEAQPSEEFSFFLGAWLGDGWADQSDGGKRLRLKVRSRDFAEEFARSASVILHKANPYVASQIQDENGIWYQVKVTSLLLYELANRSFAELVRYIEPYPAGFLRGFFTAEGNPSVAVSHDSGHAHLEVTICVSNTDLSIFTML